MGSRTFNGNISSYRCLREGIVSSVMSDSLQPHGPWSTRILCPWHSQGKNTGLPCSPPGDLPDPGIKPTSLTSPALAGEFFATSVAWKTPDLSHVYITLLQRITGGAPATGHVLQRAGSIFMHVLPASYKRIEPL